MCINAYLYLYTYACTRIQQIYNERVDTKWFNKNVIINPLLFEIVFV